MEHTKYFLPSCIRHPFSRCVYHRGNPSQAGEKQACHENDILHKPHTYKAAKTCGYIEEKHLGETIIKAGDRLALLHACGSDRGTPGWDHTNWESIKTALETINYKGQLVIESFTPEVKVIAKVASIRRTIDASGETIAREGLKFLREKFG